MFIIQASVKRTSAKEIMSLKKQNNVFWLYTFKPMLIAETILLSLTLIIYAFSIKSMYKVFMTNHLTCQWVVLSFAIIICNIFGYFAKEDEEQRIPVEEDEKLPIPLEKKDQDMEPDIPVDDSGLKRITSEIESKNTELQQLNDQIKGILDQLKVQKPLELPMINKEELECAPGVREIENNDAKIKELNDQILKLKQESQDVKAQMPLDNNISKENANEIEEIKKSYQDEMNKLTQEGNLELGGINLELQNAKGILENRNVEIESKFELLQNKMSERNNIEVKNGQIVTELENKYKSETNDCEQEISNSKEDFSSQKKKLEDKDKTQITQLKAKYKKEIDDLKSKRQSQLYAPIITYDTLFEEAISSTDKLIYSVDTNYNDKSIPQVLLEFIVDKCKDYHEYKKDEKSEMQSLVDKGENLQLHMKKLYRFDDIVAQKDLVSFHEYIDHKPLILLCVKIKGGGYVMGFSAPPLVAKYDYENTPGLMFSILGKQSKIFTLKTPEEYESQNKESELKEDETVSKPTKRKTLKEDETVSKPIRKSKVQPVKYDEYFLIWGNADIRIKEIDEPHNLYSNYGTPGGCYREPGVPFAGQAKVSGEKPPENVSGMNDFWGNEDRAQIIESYEVYQCSVRLPADYTNPNTHIIWNNQK